MTEVIVGSRGSGKTIELIKKSANDGAYILTIGRRQAEKLFNLAQSMGYAIPYPVTVEDFARSGGFRGSVIRETGLYIDDVDDIMKVLFLGIDIKGVTFTSDKVTDLNSNQLWSKQNPYLKNFDDREESGLLEE